DAVAGPGLRALRGRPRAAARLPRLHPARPGALLPRRLRPLPRRPARRRRRRAQLRRRRGGDAVPQRLRVEVPRPAGPVVAVGGGYRRSAPDRRPVPGGARAGGPGAGAGPRRPSLPDAEAAGRRPVSPLTLSPARRAAAECVVPFFPVAAAAGIVSS